MIEVIFLTEIKDPFNVFQWCDIELGLDKITKLAQCCPVEARLDELLLGFLRNFSVCNTPLVQEIDSYF